MTLHVCSDASEQLDRVCAAVAAALRAEVARHGEAVLAVSGGRSPLPLFEALARTPIDWARIVVTQVDERCVAPGHADSNAALVRRHLLRGAAAGARFEALVDDPADLRALLRRANAVARRPTLALLGMGEDGHTASLFPGAPQFAAALDPAAPAYVALQAPDVPHARISLSLAALRRAGRLLLVIRGQAKREVYARACRGADAQLPVSLLIHQTEVPFDAYWAP
jgi:6-phosphogluconolactonase